MLYHTGNPHGGDVYGRQILLDYSASINPFGTPPGVLAAMRASLDRAACYPDPYCRELVSAVAAHEGVPAGFVLCGSGAAELIYSFCLAERPRTAAELAPTFSEYALGLAQVGCTPERFPLDAESDFAPDERILPWLTERRPEVLFLCTPNNPTGRLIPRPLLERIFSACADCGTRLVLDECFLDLADTPDSLQDLLARYPNLLILKAFTKTWALAGIRLGYCLSADSRLLLRMSRTVQPWNISVPAQAAGVAALGEDEYLRRARALIPVQRGLLAEGLRKLGFRVIPSEANFLLFRGPETLGQLLAERGIAIRDCANYIGLSSGWYRIAVRLPEQNEALLRAIAEVCGAGYDSYGV